MPPKRGGGSKQPARRSLGDQPLTEKLAGWRLDPEGNPEFSKLAEDAFEGAKGSYQFDKATTQNRRRLHLKEYELFMEGLAAKQKEEFNDQFLWGETNIERNLRTYLCFAASVLKPRSYKSESIKFQTLVHRRQSMVYWITRKCTKNMKTGHIWNASQEALHYAFRKVNLPTESAEKHYLTKFDLAALIEHDMWLTVAPDVAQQHHLCWLLGFVCGVRPGSIGTARHREEQFLTWRDISIKRSSGTGSNNFTASITFRWLKGYRDETRRLLTFTCSGPVFTEDVMFSIPHRLLAILVRRNLLKDYDSLESLLSGNLINIAIKDTSLAKPVICASGPKGMDLDLSRPATCDAISAYVQRRALDYGLPAGITHYAWRRSAATRFGEALGPDRAREALGHDLTSKTFEEAYNQGTVALDAMNIALGHQARSRDILLEEQSLGINRIKQSTQSKEKWIEAFVHQDKTYQDQSKRANSARAAVQAGVNDEEAEQLAQAEEKKLFGFRRALRTQARLAFQEAELRLTADNMTQEDLEQRRKEFTQPGALQKMLLDAARKKPSEVDETAEETDLDSYEMQDLQDARDRDDTEASVPVGNFTIDDFAREETEIHADGLAEACQMLMEVLVGQKDIQKEKTSCKLCADDDSVNDQKKREEYMPGKLNQHLSTGFHSPKSKFLREHKDPAICPFGCGKKMKSGTELLRHVHSTVKQSDEHLLAAARRGLLARDFGYKENRQAKSMTRVRDGTAATFEIPDPEEVPLDALVMSDNIKITSTGQAQIRARDIALPSRSDVVLRLPTVRNLTQTSWWQEHDTGTYGDVPDRLQDQRRWIMNKVDDNLRQLGHGQASEKGETRENAIQSQRRKGVLAVLRKRLHDELNWAWAEDRESNMQPDEEEGDWEGFGDDGEGVEEEA